MRRRLLQLCPAILLLAACPAGGQGLPGFRFGVAGGAVFPVNAARTVYETGYQGSLLFNFNAPLAPVGVRLEGIYAKLDEKSASGKSGDVKLGAGTVNLVLGPRTLALRPYFVGGAGVYHLRFSETSILVTVRETQTRFGWNVGGGFSFPIGRGATMFLEARYTRIETDPTPLLRNHFVLVPVTVGFVF